MEVFQTIPPSDLSFYEQAVRLRSVGCPDGSAFNRRIRVLNFLHAQPVRPPPVADAWNSDGWYQGALGRVAYCASSGFRDGPRSARPA